MALGGEAGQVADALVLVLTGNTTLRAWQEVGLLEREWALYCELLPHYATLVVVTDGEGDEEQLARMATPTGLSSRVHVVSNGQRLPSDQFLAGVPGRVRALLARAKTAVVKTDQLAEGQVAVAIARELRAAGIAAGLLARGGYLWTRFVAHEQGPHSAQAEASAQYERELCRAADLVCGTTPKMVEDLAWRYNLNPTRTVVIPNYVLVDQPPGEPHEREKGVVLTAGALVPRKRVDLLIRAMAVVKEEVPDAVLEVVGEGPERAALEALARELGVPVRFCAWMPHLALLDRMKRAAIFAQASELEGHPKTVLEAMSSGAAVVVTDSPGLGGVVHHGVTGLRCPPDPEQLGRVLAELLRDEEWRSVMGASAARMVRAQLGLPAIVQQELDVHKRTLRCAQQGQRDDAHPDERATA